MCSQTLYPLLWQAYSVPSVLESATGLQQETFLAELSSPLAWWTKQGGWSPPSSTFGSWTTRRQHRGPSRQCAGRFEHHFRGWGSNAMTVSVNWCLSIINQKTFRGPWTSSGLSCQMFESWRRKNINSWAPHCPMAAIAPPPPLLDWPPFLVDRPPPLFDRSPPLFDWPPPSFDWPPPLFDWPHPSLDWPPPLFDRPPPLFDRSPALFDRPPPLFDRPPALFDRPPPLFDRSPALFDRPLTLFDRSPALFDRPPTLFDRAPALFDRPPPLFDRPPPLFDRPPPLFDRPPPLFDRPPPLLDRYFRQTWSGGKGRLTRTPNTLRPRQDDEVGVMDWRDDPRRNWKLCPHQKKLYLVASFNDEHCSAKEVIDDITQRQTEKGSYQGVTDNPPDGAMMYSVICQLKGGDKLCQVYPKQARTKIGAEVDNKEETVIEITLPADKQDDFVTNCTCELALNCVGATGTLGPLVLDALTHCRRWSETACGSWFPELLEMAKQRFPPWVAVYAAYSTISSFFGVSLLLCAFMAAAIL
ncbi:unnamed protein product [Cyprideis torosa]|uniref:Uncharacterized protein n=1 Tax=Cyprideis torosa TaxID=163714 RepID=A0A7R8ZR67_9CRUS|nr:unnamed protein product [Cyprideis torosa]CAG0892295.1 unnamed protein product [Cyprideis torosa]